MNKRVQRKLAVFQRLQQRNGRYHISHHTPHEQAILEHKRRGYGDGLTRQAGLLDQRNKI